MATVRFAARVAGDLREIGDWIAADDPERATSFVSELRQACLDLEHLPRAYAVVTRFGPRMRRRNYGRYAIFFEVDDRDRITIRAVVHGARDLRGLV